MTQEGFESAQRSSLDRGEVRARLERWLAARLEDPGLEILELSSPSENGMSSETLLFEARSPEAGRLQLVARVAPQTRDMPVFPRYDLAAQFRLLERVGAAGVPSPRVRWLEPDPSPLGAPFFVMERVEGRVPPDVPPYCFGGWLLEASGAERRRLEQSTLEAIAALHSIDPDKAGTDFLDFDVAGDTPLRRHVQNQRDYYAWTAADAVPRPLIERAFDWLDAHWPSQEGETVISWGDSRIGNVLYRGFEAAALLDWEMAALGPREIDLAWLCFTHRFFQDISEGAGLPGLPDFLDPAEIAGRYERISGHALRDLDWYWTYAALRHAIIMARIHRRMRHFGHSEEPADPDDVIPHRALLERMLEGWSPLG